MATATRAELIAREFSLNLDYLMQRSFLYLVRPGVNFTPILELLDKEFKIANCALKSKKKPDYVFKAIKVNFKRIRSGCIIISSLSGFTMNLSKEQAQAFEDWTNISAVLKAATWKKYMRLGTKEMGYHTYEVYESDPSMKGSISEEMRRRHKGNRHYNTLVTIAEIALEGK
jgi:hypothetical protein